MDATFTVSVFEDEAFDNIRLVELKRHKQVVVVAVYDTTVQSSVVVGNPPTPAHAADGCWYGQVVVMVAEVPLQRAYTISPLEEQR